MRLADSSGLAGWRHAMDRPGIERCELFLWYCLTALRMNLRQITALDDEECEMENINGTSPASFRWIFLCATMGIATGAPLCFAQDVQNTSHEAAIVPATVIAGVSAIVAVIAAVIASRSARAVMKSAYTMMSSQKKYGGMLPPPITITVNKKIDWARYFIGAIDTPTVLTILFSIALGVGFNLLLSRSDSRSALVPTSKPAVQASAASISAPPPPTTVAAIPPSTVPISAPPSPTAVAAIPPSTAPVSPSTAVGAVPATALPVSAPPPPISAAAAPDENEIAGLLARGRAYLSDGDVALARVFLRRAAERNDPRAALALGWTYDPAELKGLGIPNFQSHADPAKAREWYRRAADLGSAAAASRLGELSLRAIFVDERKKGDR